MKKQHFALPSIWLADFHSQEEFEAFDGSIFSVFDWLDDRILYSRHAFNYPAYCTCCSQVTRMQLNWFYGATEESGSIHPAWTETSTCENCGLNSRMRALFDFIKTQIGFDKIRKGYIAEQTTPLYRLLKKFIPSLIGSEYIDSKHQGGKIVSRGLLRIRHEDLRALSFQDNEFDIVITLDVFEHIPNYHQAFYEIYRVLVNQGYLVFTIPFFYNQKSTIIRASVSESGIVHHLPPEIHGNPISPEGSLCYQNFGWSILRDLEQCGFSNATASLYWGPWQGHLGYPFFVFAARKFD